uniref:OPA3-like protein CG13603 n=1 Tax=Elaeis guineensis var. tenera TaxID=51953 RepID=A0A8N4EPY3_ELAGV|nr:putative OPA3-like protein CG13603 [Elaeis guineensis]
MILPVVKLGTLALKILCKPIAGRLKKEAGIHPKFRQFIISFAQGVMNRSDKFREDLHPKHLYIVIEIANHRITTNIQRCIYGHSTNVEIQPLNEEKAVQAVADLIGEICLFGCRRCFNL